MRILDGIGSTEMTHIYISNSPTALRPGTSGRPVPGYRVEVVDDEGRPVPADVPGHLEVSGDSMAVGYWCDSAATHHSFRGDWMRTGDMYSCSADGYYTYLGRSDDMLRVGGEWVSPAEVEAVLVRHPAVLEAAVVGYRDDEGIQRPAAYVVATPGATIDEAELEVLCKAELAGYKRPRRYKVGRRPAEDGDRQDPALRPTRRGSVTPTRVKGRDQRSPGVHRRRRTGGQSRRGRRRAPSAGRRSCSCTRASVRSTCGARSPTTSAASVGGPVTVVYSRHGYGRSAVVDDGRGLSTTCTTRPTSSFRSCSNGSESSGRVLDRPQRRRLDRPALRRRRATGRRARPAGAPRVRRGPLDRRDRGGPRRVRARRPRRTPRPLPPRRRVDVPRLERRVAVAGVPVVEHRGPAAGDRLPRAARPGRRRPVRHPRPARRHRARCRRAVPASRAPRRRPLPHLEAPEATLDAVVAFIRDLPDQPMGVFMTDPS